MTEGTPGRCQTIVQAAGVLVALLGAACLIYTVWLFATAPTVTVVPGFMPVSQNPPAYSNNPLAGPDTGPFGAYGNIVAGILMIALGIMILLYARLRVQVPAEKSQ